ncbi:MAG TPA: hypothetical protein VJ792_08525 [Candidatus Nitrosotalea sp.]|nr:hypothetical protein [Candidatus Nitrosotalea sp.]
MVRPSAAKLAGVIVALGIVSVAGNELAFAQQPPPCGEAAYGYVGCTPLNTAQMYGAILVACIVALAASMGAVGRQYHAVH